MKEQKSSYLPALTALRGIAALWVMLFHIDVSLFYRDFGALLPRESSGLITNGYLWVDFFFILSGFVISHVYGSRFVGGVRTSTVSSYLLARLRRIYPLHLFTLLLLVPYALSAPMVAPEIVDGSWKTYFSWEAFLSQIFLTNAMNQHVYLSWNIVSWSIGAEGWTYLLAIGLLWMAARMNKLGAFVAMAVGFAALTGLAYGHAGGSLDITFDYGFLRCLFGFTIGVGLYRLYKENVGAVLLGKDFSFLLLTFAVLAVFHFDAPDVLIIPLFVLIVGAASYNNTLVAVYLSRPMAQYLGRISYSIYMVHGVVFMLLWFITPLWAGANGITAFTGWMKFAYTVLFAGLTLFGAHLTYHYIEVPGRRFMMRRGKNKALGGAQ